MDDNKVAEMTDFLSGLVAQAKRLGAEHAEAIGGYGKNRSVSVRLGKIEELEQAEAKDYGLRVIIGKKQAFISSTDLRPDTRDSLVERAVEMAKNASEDPFLTIATQEELATEFANLDLFDPTSPEMDQLIEMARNCEDAARAVAGVTNSDGASCASAHGGNVMVFSNGFCYHWLDSSFSLSASVIANSAQGMESDYAYSSSRHFSELRSADSIGREAGERAVKLLNPRKLATCNLPVIFEPRIAGGMVSVIASAVNGAAIARGTSFLKNERGNLICPANIQVIDDPLRMRGIGSGVIDAEGLAARQMAIIENGVLANWLLDLRTAKQLGLRSTAHAGRGNASAPSPGSTNMHIAAGNISPEQLIKETGNGLYITGLSGSGVSILTGDYSQGATGFMIENGEITYPVSEITIASTLQQMLKEMTPANDLEFLYSKNAPTLRLGSMTIAGL